MPSDLASSISRSAASRTWPTLPGGPSSSSDATVCTESTTRRPGRSARASSAMRSTLVSATTRIRSPAGPLVSPRRAARSRTWAADSSPVAYSTSAPEPGRDLEQERRLADPGLAAQQDDRAGHQATAEHAVQLADAHRSPDRLGRVRGVGERDGDGPTDHRDGTPARLVADDGLHEGVPLAARAALALPTRDGRTTGLADESTLDAGHARYPGPAVRLRPASSPRWPRSTGRSHRDRDRP